jgi:hypothetical protein
MKKYFIVSCAVILSWVNAKTSRGHFLLLFPLTQIYQLTQLWREKNIYEKFFIKPFHFFFS